MKQVIKDKLNTLMQRFLRLHKKNEALKHDAEELFEKTIHDAEAKQIDDVHKKIDSL